MDVQPPIPILRSFDEAKAKDFYLGFLGFTLNFEHRFSPDLPLYFAIQRDACVLHLSEHHGDATPGAALRIAVADVRGFCAALNTKNYAFARPGVSRQPFGFDDMAITDPFGNRLIFCTALPEET